MVTKLGSASWPTHIVGRFQPTDRGGSPGEKINSGHGPHAGELVLDNAKCEWVADTKGPHAVSAEEGKIAPHVGARVALGWRKGGHMGRPRSFGPNT